MLHLSPDTPWADTLEQVRRWGFNGLSLDEADLEANPAAMRAICRYLKDRGIGVFIHRDWREPESGTSYMGAMSDDAPRASAWLNPYNPTVRAYWEKRIARDYRLVPELAGYRMDGAEYYYANGAPWMGEGPEMAGKTGRECARDGIRLIAREVGKHGGTLFWETCQDDPWGQRQEFWYFQGLTGEIPANAFILIKDYYWDFHPGWPRHPLDFVMARDGRGQTPYLTSIQLPGEYTGVNDFPWCRVDHVVATIRNITATGQQGIWVAGATAFPPPWDHRLNMVNWFAVSEAIRNPQADPKALKMAWAKAEYGGAAAAAVVKILEKVTEGWARNVRVRRPVDRLPQPVSDPALSRFPSLRPVPAGAANERHDGFDPSRGHVSAGDRGPNPGRSQNPPGVQSGSDHAAAQIRGHGPEKRRRPADP